MITLDIDPTAALTTPSTDAGNYMAEARSGCGLVVSGVDSFINFVTGFSPLEEWVFKPLTGDWQAMAAGTDAWAHAGESVDAMITDIESMLAQIGDRWTGETARQFTSHQNTLVRNLSELPPACMQMSEMTAALLEAAKGIADLVAAAIDLIVGLALQLMAEAAVPVIGEAAMAASVAVFAARVSMWSVRLAEAITMFGRLVVRIVPIVNRVLEVTWKVTAILSKLQSFSRIKVATAAVTTVPGAVSSYYGAWNSTGQQPDTPDLTPPDSDETDG